MQYLLTEEEYQNLKSAAQRTFKLPTERELQKLCTDIADKMPIDWKWGKENPHRPWGCIITNPDWYCDQCPVRTICPFPSKKYSK